MKTKRERKGVAIMAMLADERVVGGAYSRNNVVFLKKNSCSELEFLKRPMGARNRGGRGLSYRPARLHRLAKFVPWNQFSGPIHV
jgi:hypothetical protein